MVRKSLRNLALSYVAVALLIPACTKPKKKSDESKTPAAEPAKIEPKAAGVVVDKALLAAFAPLPPLMTSDKNPATEPMLALGRMLYYETRLSKANDLSCNSCHMLDKYGVDGAPTSTGHNKQLGGRNSPTVYNAAGHIAQFWDGRSPDVEDQAKGPILNPVEMAMPNAEAVIALLKTIPGYVAAFKAAFPSDKDALTYDNLGRAIGAFERKLVTPSRWDAFLKGDATALTDVEKTGFLAFVEAGCPTCHSGAYVGGAMYQKLGLVKPWPNQKDLGRFDVTKKETDKMFFKVPSLRNIAKTGPYFHDGGTKSLEEAVTLMANHQLGKPLAGEKLKAVVAWLNSLTGTLPADYIKKPTLPAGK